MFMYSARAYVSRYIYYIICLQLCVCGDSALWFLKMFVRHPCPVLCPRMCMCVSCSIWKTNGPKTPETGKKGQDAHADNSILYPYPRVYHTYAPSLYTRVVFLQGLLDDDICIYIFRGKKGLKSSGSAWACT